jgi:hypothetical protein
MVGVDNAARDQVSAPKIIRVSGEQCVVEVENGKRHGSVTSGLLAFSQRR